MQIFLFINRLSNIWSLVHRCVYLYHEKSSSSTVNQRWSGPKFKLQMKKHMSFKVWLCIFWFSAYQKRVSKACGFMISSCSSITLRLMFLTPDKRWGKYSAWLTFCFLGFFALSFCHYVRCNHEFWGQKWSSGHEYVHFGVLRHNFWQQYSSRLADRLNLR